jgi:transcriptional regulator with XRE-family HTH domain
MLPQRIFPHKRYYSTGMADMLFMSPDELQAIFGKQLQELRIAKNLDQITTAEKAGISEKALRNLEAGRGSSVETLVRVLKALDSLDGLLLLAPKSSVSPLALLRHSGAVRRRVRRSRIEANQD